MITSEPAVETLVLEYCGEQHLVLASEQLTFGRSADISLDENPYLHRVLGRFHHLDGWWWLANVGTHLPIHLHGAVGTATITLSPGGAIPLVLGPTLVRFMAGPTRYELEIKTVGAYQEPVSLSAEGPATIDAASLPLTTDQLLLLVALAEPRLRRGQGAEVPSNQELIDRFGWTTTKFNRKLDLLCERFSRRGVAGLVSRDGRPANARRALLVDHVLSSGMVTGQLLSLLPPRPGRSVINANRKGDL